MVMLGDCCGKTTLLLRYKEDRFYENFFNTIGVDYCQKNFQLGEKRVKLHIWDTCGQERFENMIASYFRGVDGIMIVYDVSDEESLKRAKYWYNRLIDKYNFGQKCDGHPDFDNFKYNPIIFVGNKSDLADHTVKQEAIEFARSKCC